MITVECQHCHKPIQTYPSRKTRTKFCGRECYAAWLSKNRSGENHHMHGKRHTAESIAKMKANIPVRVGAEASNWKGGRHLSRGYWMVALSTLHPAEQVLFKSMANRSSQRVIPEHRLVMARALARPLTRDEIVHHKNGVKTDNRPENLEITGNADHKKHHAAVLRELKRLRGENEVLWHILSMCLTATSLPAGDNTSSQPA